MDQNMSYGHDYKFIPTTSIGDGITHIVADDVLCHTIQIVNICIVGNKNKWMLIDAGMPNSAAEIIEVIEERFGKDAKPTCIILTHGHFDHVGAIIELIERWNVPVYAHELELPFLTGQQKYPDPDPTVEGGMIAKLSSMFPNEPINLKGNVQKLKANGNIPEFPEWRWIHTPGHTPGHISLFREQDRTLIAGDAFVTVKQESLYKVLTQEMEISGPPRYLTPNWEQAWASVRTLEALKPAVAVTGHGLPMAEETLAKSLKNLSDNFDKIAIPDYGKYVN